MFFYIIISYLILLIIYSYEKMKNKTELVVFNIGEFIIQIIIITCFLIFYIFGLRILNIFRENEFLDLNHVDFNFKFILVFVLIYNFRKIIIYIFKISWFKFHYVMMCETNFSKKIVLTYKFFYYNFIYYPAFITFKYLIYLNYIMISCLLIIIFYDLYFNNLILDYSLVYLKYYSLYKIIYLSYKFMVTKQDLILDYYSYNLMYPGETNFINYSDSDHKKLIEESKKYISGVILEKTEYIKKYLGKTSEMSFFKSLRKL